MDSGDPDQPPGPPPVAVAAAPPQAPAEGPGDGLTSVPASGTGGPGGLGLAPAPPYAAMASDGLYARRPFNKRMPRDPVTNLRICFEFVRGACPRPPGTCRYSHNTPPQLLAVYQSMAMGTTGGGGDAAPAIDAGSLMVPLATSPQQEPQPQPDPSTGEGEAAAGGSAAAAAGGGPMGAASVDGAETPREPASSRAYFLPHIRKSIMPIDTATQRRVCFYFNVMPEGCRKATDECEFAHVYLDGALEARRRAEARGILPPITSSSGSDGGEEKQPPPPQQQRAPDGWAAGVDPRMQQQLSAISIGAAYPQPPPAVAPSSWQHQHQQHPYAPPPLDPRLVAAAARDGVVYESRPTKVYVQMPRSARTGQRVCYYHNAGKCMARACPFLHVLVDMRALRASAVVLPRSNAGEGGPGAGAGCSSVGSDMGEPPSAAPNMQRMGSAPPLVAASPTYTYPPDAYYATSGGGYGSPGYASPGYPPPSQYGGGSPPRPPHHHPPAAYGQQQQPPMPPHGGGVQRHWTT